MQPNTPHPEESNSVGFRSFNPLTFEDSVNIHPFCAQNSNTFAAFFMMVDGSVGLHSISLPKHHQQAEVFLVPVTVDEEKVASTNESNELSQSMFQIKGRQKLSHLAAKVRKTVEKLGVTSADEITRSIIGEDFQKENQAEIRKVKRRIYDTINVFVAVGEVTKTKKKILKNPKVQEGQSDPHRIQTLSKLKAQIERRKDMLKAKVDALSSRYRQYDALSSLVSRNSQRAYEGNKIPFPFIAVVSKDKDKVDVVREYGNLKLRSSGELRVLGDLDFLQSMQSPERSQKVHVDRFVQI